MANFSKIWTSRNLPEAFYTPRLIDTRPMGGGGRYEATTQFAALPDEDGAYTVKKYHKSFHIHENGGKPVVSIIATGLRKQQAQNIAMDNLAAGQREAEERHRDYADRGRLPVFFRHDAPADDGFCWLAIRKDVHAMRNPPYPVPPRPACSWLSA